MIKDDLFGFDVIGECIDFTELFDSAFQNKDGYGEVRKSRTELAGRTHIIIWEANNGKRPQGMVVMHLCNNPRCCNIDHLTLGSQAQNVYHAIDSGRQQGLDRYERRSRHHMILFGLPEWLIANQFRQTEKTVSRYRRYHQIPKRRLLGKLTPRAFKLTRGKSRYGSEPCTMELFA